MRERGGELGTVVLYVCPGDNHNASQAVCEAGDLHAGVVSEVQTRDSAGRPAQVLLALLTPRLPTVQWVIAPHAARTPGAGAVVHRLQRGAPPLEAARTPGASIEHALDFPLGVWFSRDE